MKIIIIDYKAGNILSVQNMLKKLGFKALISSDIEIIAQADKVILPGVGHFGYGMQQLSDLNLIDILHQKANIDKVPFLGICLGAQLLTQSSEESDKAGLGYFESKTIKFNSLKHPIKIPNMGWNEVYLLKKNNILFHNLHPTESRFYFVHSYHFLSSNEEEILATANYGYNFTCALNKENIFGVQFHPEKSHKFGMTLLKNFLDI